MVDDSSADRDPVEVLAEEFAERLRKGERPSITEYKSRYPDLAEDIEDIFPALAMMDEIDPSMGELSRSEPSSDEVLPKLETTRRLPHHPRSRPRRDGRRLRGRAGLARATRGPQGAALRSSSAKQKHVRRFEREARSAAKLHHTNIVPVFGVGEQDGMHYYVMQFIQGLPLDDVIEELKKFHARPTGTMNSSLSADRTTANHQKSVAKVAHVADERPICGDSHRRISTRSRILLWKQAITTLLEPILHPPRSR